MVQYLPNMYEALGPIPSSEKKKWCQFLFYFVNVPGFSKQIITSKTSLSNVEFNRRHISD